MSRSVSCIQPPHPFNPLAGGTRQPRMITHRRKYWAQHQILRIAFMGNTSPALQQKIAAAASPWLNHINLKFDWVKGGEGDIRINTNTDVYNSYLGNDSLRIPAGEATMNLSFNDTYGPDDYPGCVLHEFGHALGADHEHMHPESNIPWNFPVVYEYYARTNGWSREQTDHNVLATHKNSQFLKATAYDKLSIMHYPVEQQLTLGDWKATQSPTLSAGDIAHMSSLYPKA